MFQTKEIIIAISVILLPFYSAAQNGTRNHFLYNQNSFSVQYTAGFNQSKVTPTYGDPNRFATSIGLVHQLNLGYTFDLNPNFGLTFGAGIGMMPFNYEFVQTGEFIGSTGFSKKYTRNYNPFSRLHFMIDYHQWISKSIAFKGGLGGGFYKFTPHQTTVGNGTYSTQQYYLSFQYPGKFTPNLSAQAGLDFKLKNDDLLGISLSYDYLVGDIISGAYGIQNSDHRGFISNNGNQFNINLTYSFTQAKKMLEMEKAFYEENLSLDEGKLNFKKDKRFIDPKSCFIGVSSGLFYSRNTIENSFYPAEDGHETEWIVHANGELGIKNNFFVQVGISIAKYSSLVVINRPDFSIYFGSAPLISPTLSTGIGYRLISKNNINFLNVSAGVGLLANFNVKQNLPSMKSPMVNGNGDVQFYTQHEYNTKNHLVPTLYLNLSRDFQLTQFLYLSFDYRLNLGIINSFTQTIKFYESPNFDLPLANVSSIKGTSNAFQFGLKYKFAPKR